MEGSARTAGMLMERMHRALNDHDIDAFVDCFAPGYRSEQPVHPGRAFRGLEQVRKNWTLMFQEVPDLQAELGRLVVEANVAWAEWHWHGTRADGSLFEMRGVTIMGVEDGRASWARLYMEPVEQDGEGIDRAVARLAGGEV